MLAMAKRGPSAIILQAPRQPRHAVLIEPIVGMNDAFRVYDTSVGIRYDVNSEWIKKWGAGGIYQ